jgi:hypothetical protein
LTKFWLQMSVDDVGVALAGARADAWLGRLVEERAEVGLASAAATPVDSTATSQSCCLPAVMIAGRPRAASPHNWAAFA